MYYLTSLFNSYEPLLSECIWVITFILGGAKGIDIKLNMQKIQVYTKSFGLVLAFLSRFRVIFACSLNIFYSDKRNCRLTPAKHDLNYNLNI